ncbi:MAG TPA: polyhydroxyalkanoate synthesis repressor PhaR [Steroidobacter sp.]|uniref:polyhydroxyalkanoate synthesis repressor PhaR n=1 Tax=Steroidobacter sp. TaxID=1978227 RepID=UPI002ED774CB
MNALETSVASSSELHRGAVMSEPKIDTKTEGQESGPREDGHRADGHRDDRPTDDRLRADGDGPRVVKKYPNRRLYDTVESRYITLADIRRLVMDKIDFVVIDKKSQEDITRSILLQVIAEREHAGEPLMSQDFLSQVIRSYGGAMQCLVGSYLEQSLKLLTSQQQQMRDQMNGVFGSDAYDNIATLTQRNLERWRSVQDDIFKVMSGAASAARKDPRAEDTEASSHV